MKKTSNGYKIKDFILLGIVTAIYAVVYAGIGLATGAMSAAAHAFSTAVFGLIGGTIILFLLYKVPRKGIITLHTLLLHALFAVLGMGYFPWFIASLVGAIIADILAHSAGYESLPRNAIAYGCLQLGFSAGGIIPALFFAEHYKRTFMNRGMTAEQMDAHIAVAVGWLSVVVLIVTFLCAAAGVLIGGKILSKHFTTKKSPQERRV